VSGITSTNKRHNKPRHDNPYQPFCFDDFPYYNTNPVIDVGSRWWACHHFDVLQNMKFYLIIGMLMLFAGCNEPLGKVNGQSDDAMPNTENLAFAPYVDAAIHDKGATVIFDSILRPGEEQAIPSVVGAGSIGYYVDDQFDLDKAGGFVRIYGSDGSEGGGAIGGTISRQDGALQASYKVKNTGRLPRRLLVYTTSAEQTGSSNGG
jgi:hypothetical protein